MTTYREFKDVGQELDESRSMLDDNLDEEMKSFVKEEMATLEQRHGRLSREIIEALVTGDLRDSKDVIMEIRAGAGRRRGRTLRLRPLPNVRPLRPDPWISQ